MSGYMDTCSWWHPISQNQKGINHLLNKTQQNSEDTNINSNIENHEGETSKPVVEEINEQSSNGLENFGIEQETPDLFSSDEDSSVNEISSSENEEEEDDLEIPAFLRRQKN